MGLAVSVILFDYYGVVQAVGESQTGLRKPLIDLINQLHRQGLTTGILSNAGASLSQSLAAHGIQCFDVILTSSEIGFAKPDPRIFMRVEEQMNTVGHDILFFDDLMANVEAARAAGWQAELFIDTLQCITALTKYGIDPPSATMR
jgi:HAD superfamily hydrolase (TIGR01509 family)